MMPQEEQHFDVASYALGILDERDAARFEDHLIECPRCAYELDSFVQVADLLADVDADAVIAAEESHREGALLQNLMGDVKIERRKAGQRRLYSLAAAVVVFAVLAIGALFAGGKIFAPDQKPAGNTTAQRGSSQLDPLPNTENGPGIGGPDLAGQRYGQTDPRTGVRADVALEKKDWGTQISFAISNIKGPKTCKLVLVHTDGTTESLASWNVGDKGWGTAAQPEPLLLQAVTATQRENIAHVQVQEVAANGSASTLVSVP
jgi:hypothetical protein